MQGTLQDPLHDKGVDNMKSKKKALKIPFGITNIVTHAVVWVALFLLTVAQLILKKGSIYAVDNTRDSCPPPVQISIDEHLDYQQIVEKYFLVPHRRNIILPVGYVVLHSSFNRAPEECATLTDSIFIRFPVTEEQLESHLRVYAKKYGSKGMEFKPLSTKKIKGGPVLMIQAALNPTQFDTIYIAKRITEEEVSKYLFPADSPTEQGAVTITI